METLRLHYPDGKGPFDATMFSAAVNTVLKNAPGVYPHILGGEELHWWRFASADRYVTVDPAAPQTVLGSFPNYTKAEGETPLLDLGMERVAAAAGRFRKVPLVKRLEILEAMSELIENNSYFFLALLALEVGKPPFKDGVGEMQEAVEFPRRIADIVRAMHREAAPPIPPWKGNFHAMLRVGHGIHASIAPFNFPLAIPAHWTSCAIAAGSPFILKASAHAPLCGYWLARCWQEAFRLAGATDDGVVNFLSGDGPAMTDYVLGHPDVVSFDFTGSFPVYRELIQKHGATPRRGGGLIVPMGGETSGVNPIIVCEDADLDLAVQASLVSLCGSSGQKCSHLGNLFLERYVAAPFLDKFMRALDQMPYGAAAKIPNYCGPLISGRSVAKYEDAIAAAKAAWGFKEIYRKDIVPTGGFDFAPRILSVPETIWNDDARFLEWRNTEFFAPAVSVLRFNHFSDAIRGAATGHYRLTGSIFTKDPAKWEAFVNARIAGVMGWNSACTGALANMAFGGIAGSASSSTGLGTATRTTVGKFFTELTLSGFDPAL